MDYEHWHVSMYKKYAQKPQIRKWRDEIAQKYNIKDIFFFGDFSNHGMKYEIPSIREITNNVIETQNTSPFYKKDFTDFIMLDYIYQNAISKSSADTFIIFTGDGHFSSVVRFLVNTCKKEVIIYAVRDGLSNMLKNSASSFFEIPSEDEIRSFYYSAIANSIVPSKNKNGRSVLPTFIPTVNTVAEKYRFDKDTVKESLEEMIKLGYVSYKYRRIGKFKHIKYLCVNSEQLASIGIHVDTENERSSNNVLCSKKR